MMDSPLGAERQTVVDRSQAGLQTPVVQLQSPHSSPCLFKVMEWTSFMPSLPTSYWAPAVCGKSQGKYVKSEKTLGSP